MHYYPGQKVPRTGWRAATILMVVTGSLSTIFGIASILGAYWATVPLLGTVAGVIAGSIGHKAWRAILAGFAALSFFSWVPAATLWALFWGAFSAVWVAAMLILSSIVGAAAFIAALVEMVKTINGSDPASDMTRWQGAYSAQPSPIIIHNNANAQIGSNDNRRLTYQTIDSGRARIGVLDRGRALPDVPIYAGQPLVIGRDSMATVILSDPKASRRHAEISLEGNTWVVRDLGAMNPTRILSPSGMEQLVGGGSRRLQQGQLAIGDSIITLYPVVR